MHPLASVLLLSAPLLARSAPMKRQVNPTDLLVLNFANVLEQLETEFYTQALSTFSDEDFVAAGYIDAQLPEQQFQVMQSDEQTHATTLQNELLNLGTTPITNCTFDFSNVLTDVSTMAATARVVENLGVSAYLGAAHLISDPQLLTAAASIMSVEARHQTVLNILEGGSAIPQAFDIAFTPSEVLAVAGPFISGCDTGVAPNTNLAVTNSGPIGPGTALTFSASTLNGSTDGLFCQMLTGDVTFALVFNLSSCVVPSGINGPVAIYVTNSSQPLLSNVVERETNSVVAGPTVGFIDTVPQQLSMLALTGSATNQTSVTTQTISPSQASVIISSASAASVAAPTDSAASAAPTDSAASASPSDGGASAVAPSDGSAASATPSGSAASAAPSSVSGASSTGGNNAAGSTDEVAFPGGPNEYQGPSADGSITVQGWSSVSNTTAAVPPSS